jgi:cell division protein FtsQ
VSTTTATAPPHRRAPKPRTPAVRRRRRLLVLVLALLLLAAVAWGVSVSPFFDVDHVRVLGTSRLTAAQIQTAAGVHSGDAMLWIDTSGAVRGIEALPYVRSAKLQREWPDTVRITVQERTPVAWIEGSGGKVLVDRTGRVLEAVAAAPPAMPQLIGAKVVPPPGGRIDAVGAARVAGALTGLAAAGTTSVETTDHGILLHLAGGPEVRMGEATGIGVKIRAGLAVLNACDGKPVTYVDVSVPTNPVAGGC